MASRHFQFGLIALSSLLGAQSAMANETGCYIKRDVGVPDATHHVVAPSMADINFGHAALSYIRFVHENGKAPVLKTEGNIDKKGSVAIDPLTHQYVYRFEPLIDFNAGQYMQDGGDGDYAPIVANNWYDQRSWATITLDVQHPENNHVTFRFDRRTHTKVIGIGLSGLESWQNGKEISRPLLGCEEISPGQTSQQPSRCDDAHINWDSQPVGTRCLTSANAAVFEKVAVPASPSGTAWKGADGVKWGPSIGTHNSRADALDACRALGAELPTAHDIDVNLPDNFEDAVGFAKYGVWGQYNYKAFWLDSDYFFTYSDRPEWGDHGDAVFIVSKGFGGGHGGVDDARSSVWKKPYNTLCVWR